MNERRHRTASMPIAVSRQVVGAAVVEVVAWAVEVVVVVVIVDPCVVDEVVVDAGVDVVDVDDGGDDVVGADVEVVELLVVGTPVDDVVEVVPPIRLVEVVEAETAVLDVDVVVVVVVVGQATPQQGSVGSCVIMAGGVMVAVPRNVGGVVRQASALSLVALSVPAIVMPVLAFRKLVADGAGPGPVQMSCPVDVISIWQASISQVPPAADGAFSGSMGAVLCSFPLTVTKPPAVTLRSPPNSSDVRSTSPASTMSASLAK
jgi:hypothetical protein